MKLFVTGAGGFLGRAVVTAAAREGHAVLAMQRPTSAPRFDGSGPSVRPVAGDLRQPGAWTAALGEATGVVHCAAAASGDLATQLAGTVLATEQLLAALPEGLERFVHVSSFSVYDFGAPRRSGTLDEGTALEAQPSRRDAYTQTKLMQERMVRDHCRARGIPLVVVRPGAIYGPGKDWDYGRAVRVGPLDLIFAPFGRMALIHVEDCATAIVQALRAPIDGELIVNVVGREQPTRWAFHRQGRRAGASVGFAVPVPYAAVRLLGGAARLASRLLFAGKARLPELLDPPRQEARWRPLRFSGAKAASSLDWSERHRLETALPLVSRDPGASGG